MNQLGLPISLNTSMLLESFVANKELLRLINQLFLDENSSEVFIYGASGQGKTHVLQGAVLKALELDKNAIYYVATNDYLANGGDNMNFFKKGIQLYDLDYKLRNILIDYFKEVDTIPVINDIRITEE